MKYLIINADDFGYCPKRNQAIIDLFENKCISSTSLLVNGDYAYEACLNAKKYQIPMGIHLNLTEGRPITKDREKIESLVNVEGFMHGKYHLRSLLEENLIKQEHIEYEIDMQINKYKQLMNNDLPGYIDGHQHIHIHPMIVEIVARMAKKYQINFIRAPYDEMFLISNIDNKFYNDVVQQTKSAKKIFDGYSLYYLNYFFGLTTMGNDFTLNNIEKCLQLCSKENCFIEFMSHPGYPSHPTIGGCGTGQTDHFSQSYERQNEFDILSCTQLKDLFTKYNIQLCIYDEKFRKLFINKGMLDDDEVNADANRHE